MADVFISYKSERRAAAEHLAETLADYGYSVWWDYSLISGRDFGSQIELQLRQARAVVVLWCSLSVNSEWVREEATLAKRLDKIIPTFIEKVELPLGFSLSQTLDLSDWDGAPQSNRLDCMLRDLERLVGRSPNPNLNGLERTERAWRRFGAPSLAQFALIGALERDSPARTLPSALQGMRAKVLAPELVRIPAGRFLMGSVQAEAKYLGYDRREEPQHEVRIAKPFELGRYPVTVAEFKAFFADTGYEAGDGAAIFDGENVVLSARANWLNPGFAQDDRHPVCCVNLDDCLAYIAWINECTDGGYRLPSEAEWEYACRAGTRTPFSTGLTVSTEQANYDGRLVYGAGSIGEFRGGTTPVGSFPGNAFALCDMHGNVWEWTADWWHDNYEGAPADGSAWTTGGDSSLRVGRGGSWAHSPASMRSAHRVKGIPSDRTNMIGFRVARSVG